MLLQEFVSGIQELVNDRVKCFGEFVFGFRGRHIVLYNRESLKEMGVNWKQREITPFLRSDVLALGMKGHSGSF